MASTRPRAIDVTLPLKIQNSGEQLEMSQVIRLFAFAVRLLAFVVVLIPAATLSLLATIVWMFFVFLGMAGAGGVAGFINVDNITTGLRKSLTECLNLVPRSVGECRRALLRPENETTPSSDRRIASDKAWVAVLLGVVVVVGFYIGCIYFVRWLNSPKQESPRSDRSGPSELPDSSSANSLGSAENHPFSSKMLMPHIAALASDATGALPAIPSPKTDESSAESAPPAARPAGPPSAPPTTSPSPTPAVPPSAPSAPPFAPPAIPPEIRKAEAVSEPETAKTFTNTLGMRFTQVPGLTVLFGIHEVRKSDFLAFLRGSNGPETSEIESALRDVLSSPRLPLDHPIIKIGIRDTELFCNWLSHKEGKSYRIPTDHEWSLAVGIGDLEQPAMSPQDKDCKIANVYPWGGTWPPPPGTGNFWDESAELHAQEKGRPPQGLVSPGYDDGFPLTAPVMSFSPNRFGIYDLAGNASEWCSDRYRANGTGRVIRGSGWHNSSQEFFLSSNRVNPDSDRNVAWGFRCILEMPEEEASGDQ